MPTQGKGAIGSLDYSEDERKALAVQSSSWSCEVCGNIKNLLKTPSAHQTTDEEQQEKEHQKELAKQICFENTSKSSTKTSSTSETNSAPETEVRQRRSSDGQFVESLVHEGQNMTETLDSGSSSFFLSSYFIFALILAIGFLLIRRLFLN